TFRSARTLLQARLPDDEIYVATDRRAMGEAADVLIPMMFRIDATVMDRVRPRLIQQWGSGLEGVDLGAARSRGIPVAGVPTTGNNAESVAEHALMLILALLRKLPLGQHNVRAGILGEPMGRMLAARSVCLWGLGATALALARRLRALGVRLLGMTRDPHAEKVKVFGLDACYSTADSAACLSQTEILVLCPRLCDATRGLVNSRTLSLLSEGAYLVNTSRGALVDYDALYAALANGRLAGAALDVFWEEPIVTDDPLLSLHNVIVTPHVAGVTDESYKEIADAVAANIQRLRQGVEIANRVAAL
ncbi:MAG: hydroxyacid dehydrogenase, partial [Acidobacteria bacterium]|nr:hydroxyacid dehydrogenase [Acidobacteriota bacterium]